jgi:hypothetical protein
MKYALRLLALVGTTVFGVLSIFLVVGCIKVYLDAYTVFHRFPIYGLERDFKYLVPTFLAFACFGTLYWVLARTPRTAK